MNQNLQGAHGRIDSGPQCATIDLEVPIAHGAWPSQSLIGIFAHFGDLLYCYLWLTLFLNAIFHNYS
jgi:hypothetical protein